MAGQFFEVTIQGNRALEGDFRAIGELIARGAPVILDMSTDIGVEEAKKFVPVLTGATRDSIHKTGIMAAGPFDISVEYGPTTIYAPILERGNVSRAPQPFMLPSSDIAGDTLYTSLRAFATMAFDGGQSQGGGGKGVAGAGPVRNQFSKQRTFLYSTSKFLGDVSVLGGREIFGPLRANMMGLARLLGDIGASAYIGQRVTNRLYGRTVGRIQGYGTAALSHSQSYSGFVGGAAGHRVYSRVVGRAGNISFSGFGSLGRMF